MHTIFQSLPNIFLYFDSVKFLRDYYEARHSIDRFFSYRYIQAKTGIDPGYLYKVFQGIKPLPVKKTGILAEVLKLDKRESEYFNLLVLYNKAKSNDEIKRYFEKMLSFTELSKRKVATKEYEYYSKWYHAAIRQILSYFNFTGNYAALAKMTVPEISASEAKNAVKLLCTLGFVKKTAKGAFEVTDKFLTTGEHWHKVGVRRFQQDTIMLAKSALDTVDKSLRDISTVTITLSPDGFQEAIARIKTFRHDMLELANRQSNPDGAYHINVQMIPIGKRLGKPC
jgi:uncharacterized protein (TIGR02147 family)